MIMETNRRTFLKSIGIAGLSAVVPGCVGFVESKRPITPIPLTALKEWIGFQPIHSSTGSVFYLKTKFDESGLCGLSINKAGLSSNDMESVDVLDAIIDNSDTFDSIALGRSTSREMVFAVERAANNIAKMTRRGRGNFIIANPVIVSELKKNHSDWLNTRWKIYSVDRESLDRRVLVGYRSTSLTSRGNLISHSNLDASIISITENDTTNKLFVASDVSSYFRTIDIVV